MVQYEYANDINKKQMSAILAPSNQKYYCVECNEEMYVVNTIGNKQHPHYRHKVETDHVHEGILHCNTKHLIYEYLNYFYDNGLPLYMVIKDRHGYSHMVDILKNADILQMEKALSQVYRPDISIIGHNGIYVIEVVDTHDMETFARDYVYHNNINLIKINVTESIYRSIQDDFKNRRCVVFSSSLFLNNIGIELHSGEFDTRFDVSNLSIFCHFGMEMFNIIEWGLEDYTLKKYGLDEFMFTEKKKNELVSLVGDAYTEMDVYTEDCDSFLDKCKQERMVASKEKNRIIDAENENHRIAAYNNSRTLHTMYSRLNVFRRDVMKTGVVTPNVERDFLDAYNEYVIHKEELHWFSLMCNVRGWTDDVMRYHWADIMDTLDLHPLLCDMSARVIDEVTRHWNTTSFVNVSSSYMWK